MGTYMLTEVLEVPMPFVPVHEHSQVWTMTFDGGDKDQVQGLSSLPLQV
jgi:hypothetical protein